MTASAVSIRPAVPGDAELVCVLVRELARYERLEAEAVASPGDFDAALFGPSPRVFCEIVEIAGEPVGFALWFYSFSTFLGRSGLHLEDLFVRPPARRAGAGRALLAGLARRCREEGLGRLEWAVLDWNASALGFYRALGAEGMDGWTTHRLTGPALAALAGEGA